MIESRFDPQLHEQRIYERWEEAGCFRPSNDPDAAPYAIVIPPPNVTGSLHMGHALNNTLQDILIRHARMQGKNVRWQPGMDHAGIATQMVVERQLGQDGNQSRLELGREAFLDKVWDWKRESGGKILNQLKRLGASCDWENERFTLDEGLSEAVRKVFVDLYNEGLIYRDTRLVNWDPHFETALSNLEVESREVQGHFWHFKYKLENNETYKFPVAFDEDGTPTEWEDRDYIAIATTRPETMLGDGAVAVHPDDVRYASIVGKRVLLPLADRYIPIISDEYPDPDFGSGAVKITGAHDFNDYQVARRHDLPLYVLMDERGHMKASDIMPEAYVGLDRFEARKQVVADIDALGLLIEVEDKTIQQPFGDRS
ncbi:MAG: class I tRNA ligase family protein, partial [Henriciella sp.]